MRVGMRDVVRGACPIALLAAMAACDDLPSDPIRSSQDVSQVEQPAGRAKGWTIDDQWAELARTEIPGFAGYHTDERGNTVVSLVDVGRKGQAERHIERLRAQRGGQGLGPVVVRPARYDFAQLKGWHDGLLPLFERDDVYSTDIDETANRIRIGVASTGAIGDVTRAAVRSGVPRDAFTVVVEARSEHRQSSLTDTFRPTVAGIQIKNDYRGYCSLGFNALQNGTRVFVTASHCSQTLDGLDYSAYVQPQFGGYIGYEIDDRASVGGYFSFGGKSYACSACRLADASINAYYSNVDSRTGYIARTTFGGVNGRGSLTIDATRPTWDIANKLTMPFMGVGRWLDKQGATSGWTHGQVTETCVNRTYSGRTLQCLYRTTIWSEGGDSGSPIFLHNDQAAIHYPITTVHLAGTLVGGPTNNFNVTDFSTIEAIEQNFNTTLKVCNELNPC